MGETVIAPDTKVYRDFNVGDRLISAVAHGVILGALRNVTSHQLKDIILGKIDLDFFAEDVVDTGSVVKNRLVDLARNQPHQIASWTDYDDIMAQLLKKRPDLHRVIDTLRGRDWFKKQLERFQALLKIKVDGCPQCKGLVRRIRNTGIFYCLTCKHQVSHAHLFQ